LTVIDKKVSDALISEWDIDIPEQASILEDSKSYKKDEDILSVDTLTEQHIHNLYKPIDTIIAESSQKNRNTKISADEIRNQ